MMQEASNALQTQTSSSEQTEDPLVITREIINHMTKRRNDPNSGRPKSGKKLRRAEGLLKGLGLAMDKRVIFVPESYTHYPKNKNLGFACGRILRGEDDVPAVIQNLSKQRFDDIQGCEAVYVNTVNVYAPGKYGTRMVVCELKTGYLDVAPIGRDGEPERSSSNKSDSGTIATFVQGPRGLIRDSEFDKLVSHGCSNCTGVISSDDAHRIMWAGENQDSPLCVDCTEEWTEKTRKVVH